MLLTLAVPAAIADSEPDFEVGIVVSPYGGNVVLNWSIYTSLASQAVRGTAGLRLSYDNTKLELVSRFGQTVPLTDTMVFAAVPLLRCEDGECEDCGGTNAVHIEDPFASFIPANWGTGTSMVARGDGGNRGYISLELLRPSQNLIIPATAAGRRLAELTFAFREKSPGVKYTMADLDEDSIRLMTDAERTATGQANLVVIVVRDTATTVDTNLIYGAANTENNNLGAPAFTWVICDCTKHVCLDCSPPRTCDAHGCTLDPCNRPCNAHNCTTGPCDRACTLHICPDPACNRTCALPICIIDPCDRTPDFEVGTVISQAGGNVVLDWNLTSLVENQSLRNLAGIRLSYDNTKLQLISGIDGVPIPLTGTMAYVDLDEDDAIASNLPLNWGAGTTMVAQGAGESRGYITLEIQRTQSSLVLVKDVDRRLARIQFAFRDNPAGGKYTMADLDETSIRFMTGAELAATEQANLVRFVTRADGTTTDVDHRYGAVNMAQFPDTIYTPVFTWITGFTVTGQVKSYNPKNATLLQLMQGGEVLYKTDIKAAGGEGQQTQPFTFDNVAPGTYTLVVTKDAHTSFTINNFAVGEEDIDLTAHTRSDISTMILRGGDLDESNNINQDDLAILINSANYGRGVGLAANSLADLDGSGSINQDDLAILINSANYGRGAVVLNFALPGVGQ
jgi:hypothetical protein